jgi:hypothetical protein
MCCNPIKGSESNGNYIFELTENEREKFQRALDDFLTGKVTEPDRTFREMAVRLRRATRRKRDTQQ